ncbi:MAG: hypothetical protein C4530_03860 [Desulfobacteraceae bacterium]|nr:MAG: hypothetical protein C4530_03860 [Desulfobacteraceae bacterium]
MNKGRSGHKKGRHILGVLMDPSRPDASPWSPGDFRAILEHQLATPLLSELERFADIASCSPEGILSLLADCGCSRHTFGDLLNLVAPPISVLKLLKDYAKASLTGKGDLPEEVARVLYIVVILQGLKIGSRAISSLDDAIIKREARRCQTFGWLPENIRELLRYSIGSNKKRADS